MTFDEFRFEMESYRQSAVNDAKLFKNSQIVFEKLRALYGKFDESERLMANDVLTRWALSENEDMRFDALSLIDEFAVRSSIPALNELIVRLANSDLPSAPFELKKVSRIISKLENLSD